MCSLWISIEANIIGNVFFFTKMSTVVNRKNIKMLQYAIQKIIDLLCIINGHNFDSVEECISIQNVKRFSIVCLVVLYRKDGLSEILHFFFSINICFVS